MATLQDIKRKIGAVKKTQQITKAMNMVSAAKLRGAQLRMEGFRPYAGAFAMMLGNMAGRVEPEIHPFFQQAAPVERVGLVLMTADRGLCGSFNVNLINTAVKFIREKEAAGIEVSLICVGRKGRDFFRRRKREMLADNQTWNRRYREYMEKIKTGSLFDVAEVFRDLFRLKLTKDLSFGERKLYDTAQVLLVKELSKAKKTDEKTIISEIESLFAHEAA